MASFERATLVYDAPSGWYVRCLAANMISTRGLLTGLLVFGVAACDSGSGGSDDGGGTDKGRFTLDYRSGESALLDLRVDADLRFSGTPPGVPSTLDSVGVGQAHAIFQGNGQQRIELVLSTGSALYEGETFSVTLEFSRANDGAILDAGDALNMGCDLYWTGPDYDFGTSGDCSVTQGNGGYSLTIVETYDEETTVSGTVSFSPVSNEAYAFTPGYGCPEDQICLSLDASDYDAETGYCLPTSNLKSDAAPCSAECTSQLTIEAGGTSTCVCSSPCGRIDAGGGGGPPVCDPAYGCIDY